MKSEHEKLDINERLEKLAERWEGNKPRLYSIRLFGKYDIRDEQQFIKLGKWLIFIILVIMEGLIVLQHVDHFSERGGWGMLIAILAIETVLTLSEALKLFIVKQGRVIFYVIDAAAACCFMFTTVGMYPLIVYMLVLTEFYIGAKHVLPSILLLAFSIPLYVGSYFIKTLFIQGGDVTLLPVLTECISAALMLGAHFLISHIALAFYRQYLKLDKTLKKLDESKRELEKAYAVVAEVTALEERQRIAKEIHDTAGHSLTTVIMQTEAAKLIIDKNPDEAKGKIIAANLQAKHALEELRDSVHLLSGIAGNKTLKAALEDVIHESTDGTGITIRSEIEDVTVSEAKHRFLCNTLKEGVSNGLRHGGATAFWFELKSDGEKLSFLLSDNGKGIDPTGLTLGFGLTTMRERVKSFGGEAWFDGAPDDGFEIHITLPLDHPSVPATYRSSS